MKTITMTLCFIFLFASISLSDSPKRIKITSLEWPPYSGADLELNGTAINKLARILMKYNTGLAVEFYPWERAVIVSKSIDYEG